MVKYGRELIELLASGFAMSPKLKFWLDRLVIKPVVVYDPWDEGRISKKMKLKSK